MFPSITNLILKTCSDEVTLYCLNRMTESLTLADVRLWIEDVSFGTLTGETAWCVSAQTVVTQLPVYQTFINI